MQQAQKQAHQTQYQIQQMQKAGGLLQKVEDSQSTQGSSVQIKSKSSVTNKE